MNGLDVSGTQSASTSSSSFARDPLEFVSRAARSGQSVTSFRVAGANAVLITDPSLIEELLVRKSSDFIKAGAVKTQRRLLGNGLLVNDGESWAAQRRLAQPLFHPGNLAPYVPVITANARQMLDGWHKHGQRDAVHEFQNLFMNIAAEAAFGADLGPRAAQIGGSVDSAAVKFSEHPGFMPEWVPVGNSGRYARAVRDLDAFIESAITHKTSTPPARPDFLFTLMNMRGDSGAPMSPIQLRDEVINLFLGGFDSSWCAMAWTFYLLATHPEVARRVNDEVDVILHGRAPMFADYQKLLFLQKVLKESLRLYPPTWMIAREASADTEIGATKISKGTMVIVSPWAMHRSDKYFDLPLDFRPDRWDADTAWPGFVYLPFGAGPRACIGASFATLQCTLVLAMVAQRFRFAIDARTPVHPHAGPALRPASAMNARLFPR